MSLAFPAPQAIYDGLVFRVNGVPAPPVGDFGAGSEAQLASALVELGAQRVLLVASERHPEGAERLSRALGPRSA